MVIVWKCKGRQVGRTHMHSGSDFRREIAYTAAWQARVRQAIVVAENEHGERLAVGDPKTEAFWV